MAPLTGTELPVLGTGRLQQPAGTCPLCPGDTAESPRARDKETHRHTPRDRDADTQGSDETGNPGLLLHEIKTEVQIRNLERNLHSAPETPRIPGRRPQDLWAGGAQGLHTRRLRAVCGVWTCLPRPPGRPGAASAARAHSLPPPAPPSIAPAESHPGHPSLPVSPRRAAIRASPSPPLASGPPSEAPYPCCFVLLLHRRESATPVRNPQGLCSPVTRHTSLGLVPRGPRPLASAPPTWLPRPGVRPLLQEAFPGSLIPRVHVPSETASQNFP